MALKKTELYVENRQIDLYGDEAFVLNFNIAEINDISAKASAYSKELDIPASKENNQTFSHLFDINSEGYFNPLAKKTAQIYVDGVCVMQGFFKLNSITISDAEYVTYHGVIYEDSINFLQSLGDLELTNLVLPLTGTTQQANIGNNGTITINGLTGTDYLFRPAANPGQYGYNASRKYNVNYTNAFNTGGLFGSLQPVDKNIPNAPWDGTAHSNANINAYVALTPITINLTPNIHFITPRVLVWQWVKVIPSGSTYIHIPIGGGSSNPAWQLITDITTPSGPVTLQIGEGIYLYISDKKPLYNYGTFGQFPYPPINIAPYSQITGSIQAVNNIPSNSLLIDENFVLSNMNTVSSSLTGDICFPIIDYNQTFPYSASNKTIGTINEHENSAVRVRFEDIRPTVFVKKVWDAIFEQAGFKYKSKFLDTNANMFRKLIIAGGMEEDAIQSLQYESILKGNADAPINEPVQDVENNPGAVSYSYDYKAFLLGGKTPNNWPTYWWSNTIRRPSYVEKLKQTYVDANRNNAAHGYQGYEYGDVLKAFVGGKYRIEAQIDATSLYTVYGSTAADIYYQDVKVFLRIEVIKGGSYNNDPVLFTAPAKSQWKEVKVITYTRAQNYNNQDFTLKLDEILELEKGDLARVVMYSSAEAQFDPNGADPIGYTSRMMVKRNTSFVRYYRLGTWMGYEATSITNMLPQGMKQSDFIMGIAKMFNLYFESDKQDPKTIWIEPRDTYYEDGKVLNWEKKLDFSTPINIDVLPHNQAKSFVFKYKDDSNDYNTETFKKYNENGLTFGSYEFVSKDEYVNETSELELPFASSYLQKIAGTDPIPSYTGANANPMVITKIISPDSQKPEYEGDASTWKKEPRILYYGGKITLPPYQYRNYQLFFQGNEPDGDTYDLDMAYYTYAGHFDRPVEPTLDINFFTDTHYLPTSWWNNSYGNVTTCNSYTYINMATIIIGNVYVIQKSNPTYYNLSAYVDKYIMVTNQNTNNHGEYFVGIVTANTNTTVSIKVTQKYYPVNQNGVPLYSTVFNNWKVQMTDALMKYDLFNVFYKNQMLELTDQSARLMTCNMYLTPTDIANFRFNDIVYANKEYWRVNKIVDYDTSSDINQTTQVELIKILRANTNRLIDYVNGGYLGVNGGTAGGITNGTSTTAGTTPSVVAIGPAGTLGSYTDETANSVQVARNSIIKDADGNVSRYFEKEVQIKTGTQELTDKVIKIGNDLNVVRTLADNKAVGQSITLIDEDETFQLIADGIEQVYFDIRDNKKLFNIALQDIQPDGYTIRFDALNDTTRTFIQFSNNYITSNEIFVIDACNGVTVRFDAEKTKWIIV